MINDIMIEVCYKMVGFVFIKIIVNLDGFFVEMFYVSKYGFNIYIKYWFNFKYLYFDTYISENLYILKEDDVIIVIYNIVLRMYSE